LKITLGVDIGSTSTKVVAVDKDLKIIAKTHAKTKDRLVSMHGGMGALLQELCKAFDNVEKIALTGAGASWLDIDNVQGVEVVKVAESAAVGIGALTLAGLSEALVMNIGTGTVFVHAGEDGITHAGGSGLGGATLVGLAGRMIGETKVAKLSELADGGDLKKIDLMMGDIYNMQFSFLPPDASAANFGNFASDASREDIALGLFSTIYQVLGVMAVFAGRAKECSTVAVAGALAEFPQARKVLPLVGGLYGVEFVFCENALHATAFGAALKIINER